MPLIAMMYPRGAAIKNEHDPDVVAHAARAGAELGADVVKTNYTGDPDTFQDSRQGLSCTHYHRRRTQDEARTWTSWKLSRMLSPQAQKG